MHSRRTKFWDEIWPTDLLLPFLLGPPSSETLGEKEAKKKADLSFLELVHSSHPSVIASWFSGCKGQKKKHCLVPQCWCSEMQCTVPCLVEPDYHSANFPSSQSVTHAIGSSLIQCTDLLCASTMGSMPVTFWGIQWRNERHILTTPRGSMQVAPPLPSSVSFYWQSKHQNKDMQFWARENLMSRSREVSHRACLFPIPNETQSTQFVGWKIKVFCQRPLWVSDS